MMKVRRKKIIGGKRAYPTGIVVALVKAMRNKCRVTADGELLNPKGEILLCTIANGQYVGGSYRCAPRSVDNDGKLEVCVVKPVSRVKFLSLMNYYKEGTHLSDPKFEKVLRYCRAERVEVEAPAGFVYSFDGELIKDNHFTVEVAHRALRFAVPKGAKPIVDPKYLPTEEKEPATV
jgi:diacylglycerol kinase (ATP)